MYFRDWCSDLCSSVLGGTGTCSLASPVTLTSGAGRWFIVTGSASGNGPWSAEMDFTVP